MIVGITHTMRVTPPRKGELRRWGQHEASTQNRMEQVLDEDPKQKTKKKRYILLKSQR